MKTMKRFMVFFLVSLLFISGCAPKKPAPTETPKNLVQKTAVLYFANKEGADLTAVNLDIEEGVTREELPRYVKAAGRADTAGFDTSYSCRDTADFHCGGSRPGDTGCYKRVLS